jgi:signal transduction histidine kinase
MARVSSGLNLFPMQKLVSALSIKSRIFLGYLLISLFIIVLSIISYKGIAETINSFSNYVSSNEKTTYILSVDNAVLSLQRDVQDYIYTGYEAIAEKVLIGLASLESQLFSREKDFESDDEATEYIKRMETHLSNYSKAFNYAAEERRKRQLYISEVNVLTVNLLESGELPLSIEIKVVESNKRLFEYIEDPDIRKINEVIQALDIKFSKIKSEAIKEKYRQYRAKYLEVIQSTRGFLYLLSVVMSGEAQEFRYTSEKLKELILSKNEPIKRLFSEKIKNTKDLIFNASIVLFLLALLFSFTISKSISRPLFNLTDTFNKLAKDEKVKSIPGQEYDDEIGQMSRAAEIFRKKNEQTKQILETLDEKKEALEKSNAELQRFAYVASHDLQEPLRMVSSYTQLLEKRYKDKLDDDANEFIEYAVDGAKRMQTLINDLLSFSRVDSMGKQVKELNTNSIFDYVLNSLKVSVDETNATVSRENMPSVSGDEGQLKQLFQNLLANALKYHDPNREIKVHCSFKDAGSHWMFAIKDNGIGIEEEYFEKIFVIFQRLHTKHEYSGTGIGLALCKKIIERHGGEIWLESKLGEGTTFFFTIPKMNIN